MVTSTTTYTFPAASHVRPWEIEAYIRIIEDAFNAVDIPTSIASIRTVDLTPGINAKLEGIKSAVREFQFKNSYRLEETYSTTSRQDIIKLRRDLTGCMYKAAGAFADFELIVEVQLFDMKYTNTVQHNEQVTTLNSFNQEVVSADQMKAQLAISNLQALVRYFDSLEASTVFDILVLALEAIDNTKPVISLGALVYNAKAEQDVQWLPTVEF